MKYPNLYILLVVCLMSCQNSLASSVKEGSKIEKNVENPTIFSEKSTKPPLKGHILMFHNQGTRSHLIVMSALAKALLENGYKVTTVFYAKMNIVHENYNEILIQDQ